jgi:hypothetical protein
MMMSDWTRRRFFLASAIGGLAASGRRLFGATLGPADAASRDRFAGREAALQGVAPKARPIIISSANGVAHLDDGMAVLKSGGDTLDAALAVVTKVEDDPEDDSVGYGGLPNEEGVVELDASVMHGPTRRAGAVASVQKIKNPSLVAKTVMNKTNHVFIVGEGARRFAVDEGFQEMNLLIARAWPGSPGKPRLPRIGAPAWIVPSGKKKLPSCWIRRSAKPGPRTSSKSSRIRRRGRLIALQ